MRKDVVFKYRLYSAMELTIQLREAGFQVIKIYGNLAGSPYDHTAKRLVALGIKRNEQTDLPSLK